MEFCTDPQGRLANTTKQCVSIAISNRLTAVRPVSRTPVPGRHLNPVSVLVIEYTFTPTKSGILPPIGTSCLVSMDQQ